MASTYIDPVFAASIAALPLSEEQKTEILRLHIEANQRTIEAMGRNDVSGASQPSTPPKNENICPEHPEDLFSGILIDTELSKADTDELQMLKYIYKVIAYSPKMPYLTGNPRFAMRLLDFTEPNIENIIVGECQSGKSAEIAWTAWCSFFVLGCLPVIYIRNNGGRTQGIEDMISAVLKLNDRITEVLRTAENAPEFSGMIDKVRRTVDNRRFLMEIITDASKIEANGLAFRSGIVLISLLNVTHLRKLMEPFRKSRQQWFLAHVVARRGAGWEVQYQDCDEKEVLGMSNLKTSSRKKILTAGTELVPGTLVLARKSAELAGQDGLLKSMRRYGEKEGKRRLLFIMDEADLSVGNPERNKNQGEKLMYQSHEHGDLYKENRGAREYVYGSVFVTATPQALFICAWKSTGRPQGRRIAAADASDDGGSAAADARAPAMAGLGLGSESSIAVPDETDSSDEEDDGRAVRVLKPHVVYMDLPNNYVAYRTPRGPANGLAVERRVLDERFQRVKNMTQIYREIWIASRGSEEDWTAMQREVVRSREARNLWPGVELRFNGKTGGAQVHTASLRRRDREQDAFYNSVKDMFHQAKALQRGQTIWQQDGEAILEMLLDMLVDSEQEPFRHALIISDKTKTIQKQRTLAQDILARFGGAPELAVAVYNCSDGVTVGFSAAMHACDVLCRAADATQRAARELQREKERCGLPRGPAGSVAVEHGQLVISGLPIGVMYEGLKGLCSRIVVIAGEIGGRGVAYHDLRHERILTDMYTAQEVFADATITQHGELLTQVLGRLNTIETFSLRGHLVPAVRLWATQSVHDLHELVLGEVQALCKAVESERDYGKALRSRPLWITGETARGDPIPLRMSRPAFSARKEREMRHGGACKAPITDRRHRGVRIAAAAALFPPKSACTCVERMPHAAGDSGGVDDGSDGDIAPEDYQWDPRGGAEWSADVHSLYQVEVPPALLDTDAAARFCAAHEALSLPPPPPPPVAGGRQGPWRFKTLRAARAFVAAGAAGPKEARLFTVLFAGLLDDVLGPQPGAMSSDGGKTESDSELSVSESSSGSPLTESSAAFLPRQKRRLDFNPDGSGGGSSGVCRGGGDLAAGGACQQATGE